MERSVIPRSISAIAAMLMVAALGACSAPPPAKHGGTPNRPLRVVSLDYCADQYVLKLLDRDRILAVSPDAGRPFSYMRAAADGVPRVRARAEDILVLRPDLIVRSYGGGPNAPAFFERAGIPVVQIGYASSVVGLSATLRAVAKGLGEPARGDAIIDRMTRRLAALAAATARAPQALYMTPAGVTTGTGTLIHDMLTTAGLANFQTEQGWRALPLERLAYEQPDLVAAAFFEVIETHPDAWSAMRHPVARRQLTERPVVPLNGAWTACGAWFILDAVEALAAARAGLEAAP